MTTKEKEIIVSTYQKGISWIYGVINFFLTLIFNTLIITLFNLGSYLFSGDDPTKGESFFWVMSGIVMSGFLPGYVLIHLLTEQRWTKQSMLCHLRKLKIETNKKMMNEAHDREKNHDEITASIEAAIAQVIQSKNVSLLI